MLSSIQISVVVFVALACQQVVFSLEICTAIGPRCSDDCQSIEVCASIGLEPYIVDHCFKDVYLYCGQDSVSGNFGCISTKCSNPNITHPFTCLDVGTFPSAYHCDTSFVCNETYREPILQCQCDVGEYYDVNTDSCVKEPGCPLIPADCSTIGQYTELGNGFCYTCGLDRYAFVYRCGNNVLTTPDAASHLEVPRGTRGATCVPYSD